jgi:hypothetical protein
MCIFYLSYVCLYPPLFHPRSFNNQNDTWWRVQIMKLLITQTQSRAQNSPPLFPILSHKNTVHAL